jgi:hypothetical protein
VTRTLYKSTEQLPEGATLELGSKELEVNSLIPHEEFMSGKVFLSNDSTSGAGPDSSNSLVSAFSAATSKSASQGAKKRFMNPNGSASASKTGAGGLNPGVGSSRMGGMRRPTWAHTRMTHDPSAPGALVLLRTKGEVSEGGDGGDDACVVVDPLLGDVLRPHQRDGVQFLFDSVTGKIDPSQLGCILADEMVSESVRISRTGACAWLVVCCVWLGLLCAVLGLLSVVLGLLFVVLGLYIVVLGLLFVVLGSLPVVIGLLTVVLGFLSVVFRFEMQTVGFFICSIPWTTKPFALFCCVSGYTYQQGLGKTLQVISLIWTLLKQGTDRSRNFIEKAIIVCPASLTHNWKSEFRKWVGGRRIAPIAVTDGGKAGMYWLCKLVCVALVS